MKISWVKCVSIDPTDTGLKPVQIYSRYLSEFGTVQGTTDGGRGGSTVRPEHPLKKIYLLFGFWPHVDTFQTVIGVTVHKCGKILRSLCVGCIGVSASAVSITLCAVPGRFTQ